MIVALGFRVNSYNAIIFRKWANNVLESFMINGYHYSTGNDYVSAIVLKMRDELVSLDNRVQRLENQSEIKEIIFKDGKYFDAFICLKELVGTAKKNITIIDNYADDSILSLLSNVSKEIVIRIITTHKKANITEFGLQSFNKQYRNIDILYTNKIHDRFIIIDDIVYHLGTSINSVGSRLSMLSKVDDELIKSTLLSYIQDLLNSQ